MPKIARIAYVVAFIAAGLICISALIGQIVVLPFSLIPLMAGIGIQRKRAWSAYGFALYHLGQLLLIPLVLLGSHNHATGIIVPAATSAILIVLFFRAGKSLRVSGSERGWAWPWIAVTALTSLPLFFIQVLVIPTPSMEDTLLIGDRVLVQLFPKPRPERGDVIVLVFPIDRSQRYVKRVIGVPGDHIRIAGKVVYRNGAALNEPYAVHKFNSVESYRDNFPSEPLGPVADPAREMLKEDVVNGEVIVPEGKYFVLGDNRDNSLDSRYWGFVNPGDLIGKPLLIVGSDDQSTDQIVGKTVPSWPRRVRWGRLFRML